MSTYRLSEGFIGRFRDYVASLEYRQLSDHAEAEYWKHQSGLIDVRISGNEVTVKGGSGYHPLSTKGSYVGPALDALRQMKRRIAGWRGDNRIKLLSPFAAFDAVMAALAGFRPPVGSL